MAAYCVHKGANDETWTLLLYRRERHGMRCMIDVVARHGWLTTRLVLLHGHLTLSSEVVAGMLLARGRQKDSRHADCFPAACGG